MHRQTDRQTDKPKAICPSNFFKVGGIIKRLPDLHKEHDLNAEMASSSERFINFRKEELKKFPDLCQNFKIP